MFPFSCFPMYKKNNKNNLNMIEGIIFTFFFLEKNIERNVERKKNFRIIFPIYMKSCKIIYI